jgi:hypothetical protein
VVRSDSDVWTPAVGGGVVGRRAAVGTNTHGPESAFKARHGAWQPRNDGALTGGPSAERGRLTGGPHMSAISELKFTTGQK